MREAKPGTLGHRRARLLGKLKARGGQSQDFFRELAASLGYSSVTFNRPGKKAFRAGGTATAGDPLRGGDWLWTWEMLTSTGPDDDGLRDLVLAYAHEDVFVIVTFT